MKRFVVLLTLLVSSAPVCALDLNGLKAKLGLVKERDAHLDDYITRKALDGLFLKMAEQEKEIRAHPLQATGDLAKKVFAVLRGQ